jgi:hypothetical protein
MSSDRVVKVGKFISITWTRTSKSGLTQIYVIESRNGVKLGAVKWHGQWRKYVFCPSPNTLFDEKCMVEIGLFLIDATLNHKQNNEQTQL